MSVVINSDEMYTAEKNEKSPEGHRFFFYRNLFYSEHFYDVKTKQQTFILEKAVDDKK